MGPAVVVAFAEVEIPGPAGRPHHLVIWGAVFVAGLLPIWGGLGADRDALAMIPLGLVTMVSGLFDQRLLARSLALPTGDRLEGTRVGG